MKSTARIISIFIPVLLAMQAAVAKPEAITPKPSTEVVREVLTEALCGPDGEYAAHATYQAVMDKFGGKLPYANIIKAESRHIGALQRQFEKYGLAIPQDTRAGHIKAPASLAEAAQLGIEAEKANVAMYDRLLYCCSYPRRRWRQQQQNPKRNDVPPATRRKGWLTPSLSHQIRYT